MTTGFVPGPPGPRAAIPMVHKSVLLGGFADFLPGGGKIDTTATRDITNTVSPTLLSPGLLMGQITSSKKWANSIIGISANALTGAGTTVTVSAAQAVELVRRNGATGTFKLTGPTAANGVARTLTVTYSAVNQSTGAITITALGVNQVDQIDIAPASTAGNLKLTVQKTDGTFATTGNIAWNATDATYLASINTALDTATGVVGGIVASAIPAVDTDLGFRLTYSGTGYAGLTWAAASVAQFPTSSTAWSTWRVTAAVSGAFVAGSFVQPTDGSETPKSFVFDGYGITMALDTASLPSYAEWPDIPVSGKVITAQLINWPTDVGLRNFIMTSLSTASGGKFVFDAAYL